MIFKLKSSNVKPIFEVDIYHRKSWGNNILINNSTITVINEYISGLNDEKTAIALLLPLKLKDQYVFCSEVALLLLKFKEAIEI